MGRAGGGPMRSCGCARLTPCSCHIQFSLDKKKKEKKKAAGDSTRHENDELVIETQDLSLDGNVLEGSHKRRGPGGGGVVSIKLRILQPEIFKHSRQQQRTSIKVTEAT